MKETLKPPYRYMIQRLKEARIEVGLTQIAVADALDETQTWVSKVERGERRIDPVELSQFASLYRKPVDYFLLEVPVAESEVIEPLEVTLTFEGEVAKKIRERAFRDGVGEENILASILEKQLIGCG